MDYLTILDSVSEAIRMFKKNRPLLVDALNIMNDILHCHINNARNGWDLQFHFCFTMAFDTYMYGRCFSPIDMEHPHLELSVKMKLSWCPAGGKVKRRCSRNHWVGKSASVLVALWLFKSLSHHSHPLVGVYDFMFIVQHSADHWIFIFHMRSTIGQKEQEMRPLGN